MFTRFASALILSAVFLIAATSARGAERVRAGQWETTMTAGAGKPTVTKYCIKAAEAKAMNGDLATLRKYLEDSTAENTGARCVVKHVELKGNRTVVTVACGEIQLVSTTTYHGDRYEASSSNGMKVTGRRIGACR